MATTKVPLPFWLDVQSSRNSWHFTLTNFKSLMPTSKTTEHLCILNRNLPQPHDEWASHCPHQMNLSQIKVWRGKGSSGYATFWLWNEGIDVHTIHANWVPDTCNEGRLTKSILILSPLPIQGGVASFDWDPAGGPHWLSSKSDPQFQLLVQKD